MQPSENKMGEIIRASLSGIKDFADAEGAIGAPIHTPSGVTVIPVSKVSIGFATGGLDFGTKKISNQSFGGGGGSGVSITPIAFLTVGRNAEVNLIPISGASGGLDHALSVIERSPEILQKIKNVLS